MRHEQQKKQKDLPLLAELKMTLWGYSTSNASTNKMRPVLVMTNPLALTGMSAGSGNSRFRFICSHLTIPCFADFFPQDTFVSSS
jgi:hypothetical protein